MVLADQLGADWSRVEARHAPVRVEFGRQSTGGSTSIRNGIGDLRKAGAAAREMLVAAAAARWQVPAADLEVAKGVVKHAGKSARFGELAEAAAALEPPAEPEIRPDSKLIGSAVRRLDLPDKVTGAATFGIDVHRPDMQVARVVHSPVFGGTVKKVNDEAARAVDGVRDVVQIPTGVAVVADHFWAADKGAKALAVEWDEGDGANLDSASLTRRLKAIAGRGKSARNDGDVAAALKKGKKLEAVYEVPYLAHAPMEPLSCTAEVTDDSCELWVSTQGPTGAQAKAAEITGLDPSKIKVHSMMLGGGFGRRSQSDFVADAVHVAKATGKPVKVIWTREDDIRMGMYRPAAYNLMTGAVDGDGWPVAWRHQIASPSIVHVFGPLKDGIDGTAVEGASNLPYAIPNQQITYARPELPVTTWFWRSVGSSQNAYVTECFLDELAALGGKDPLELRRRLLADAPRHLRALERAAEAAGWGKDLPEGHAQGLAVHESFGSIVAQVAQVSIDGDRPRVHEVTCAVDCGQVINPDTIAAQMDSSIAYGLSAALHGRIDFERGRVVQSNFHDYPIVRLGEMPRVDTIIIAEGEPHGGIGEPGLPPIAPAVCNALRTLTGTPIRSLPIRLEA
jgi:isoquinoline 1-oxidoreductase subunit beta